MKDPVYKLIELTGGGKKSGSGRNLKLCLP